MNIYPVLRPEYQKIYTYVKNLFDSRYTKLSNDQQRKKYIFLKMFIDQDILDMRTRHAVGSSPTGSITKQFMKLCKV